MPKPNRNESKKAFIRRCVPVVQQHGTAKSPEQAVAICNSIWKNKKR